MLSESRVEVTLRYRIGHAPALRSELPICASKPNFIVSDITIVKAL